jgi:hypothetical protein
MDGFTFLVLPNPLISLSLIHLVAGTIPFLVKYVEERQKRDLTPFESSNYHSALEELKKFMFVDGLR